jgi:predicted N-acyltransferase
MTQDRKPADRMPQDAAKDTVPTPDGEAPPAALVLKSVPAIAAIPAADWNACAAVEVSDETAAQASDRTSVCAYNPFVTHEFLSSLEDSDSVGRKTGWIVQHLVAEAPNGEIAGVVPAYVKTHSRGEYVFDGGWAEAYERAGGDYYPKLQVSVPFTPATGPRFLTRAGADAATVKDALAKGLVGLSHQLQCSSVHLTFLPKGDWDWLAGMGFLQRTDQQFHFENAGFATFEDFLSALAARKRKVIRRERKDATANGITIHCLTGRDLTEDVWDAFFDFYTETGSRKWGRPYLTRQFYSLIGERMADRILLVMAKRGGRWIAGAINFIGADTLYGRHWGAIEDHPFLHFEVCYYQAIAYAIEHRLRFVEAGAQGEHKIARGYLPKTTYSAHYIADPALRRAIADYLTRERAYVAAAGEELAAFAPFRKDAIPDQT